MPAKRQKENSSVTMVGLDFGSTTSSAIVAHASVGHNLVTGRMAFGNPDIVYRSEQIFTPFKNNLIDETSLKRHLDTWLNESGVDCSNIFAGGAIITGLATEKSNAGFIASLVKDRIGEAIIAAASDPCLESWLAFMGSCSALSRCNPELPILNLDIGGGTTNPALGINSNVLATGCYFVGARHFQFEPGTYRITAISNYGRILLKSLHIQKNIDDSLEADERQAILNFYLKILENIATGSLDRTDNSAVKAHTQIPIDMKGLAHKPALIFSGGVGELIYQHVMGQPLPATTFFGDLGIDLARAIINSPILSAGISTFIPENLGRATVYGIAIHSTEISGSTLFLPNPETLPLRDLPILGKMSMDADQAKIGQLLALVAKSSNGGAIQITSIPASAKDKGLLQGPEIETFAQIKSLGQRIRDGLIAEKISAKTPLVLLVPRNIGKSLGNYATDWRKIPTNLVVIDEIQDRNAHFVNIGNIHNNIAPVSFYGVQ
jgi:ethanolamine utilization protein EutA